MLLSPNKRTISIILERIKPEKKEEGKKDYYDGDPQEAKKEMLETLTDYKHDEHEEAETVKEEDCIEAAGQILEAMKVGDAKALHEALRDYFDLAKGY